MKRKTLRRKSERAPMGITSTYDKEVENVMAERVVRGRDNHPSHEYLVKWKGLSESEASWELLIMYELESAEWALEKPNNIHIVDGSSSKPKET
ncbi:hypothetical protein FNV43_RR00604 [Rhamnella rubrinervis]|uniref:Chromo domain-containing protein n=1 Tax=Rhamnella rubrinervis TaxID=2594499 RepID=A0A8K0MRB6_9ROSA|nr:hypothetical protein FNV43_RR00604 [Rhamnella rubrinervis]